MIVNISILMLAAILLIGFSMAKINERSLVEEKLKAGGRVIEDFQSVMDFLSREEKRFSLDEPASRKEVQDFIGIYSKQKGFYHLVLTDLNSNVVAGKKADQINKTYSSVMLEKTIQSGEFHVEIEKAGSFFSTSYRKLVIYSPLWIHGRVAGGVHIEMPVEDMMVHLMASQRMILILMVLNAVVLIVFGSFLLSRVLVNPLKNLVQLTHSISEGDLSHTIEVTSKNEIGQLISSFNGMIQKLRENQESLGNYVKSLESANLKLKQAQEELIRTEKLATLGRFAAGVAHEVGNPLGAILGYTSILEKDGLGSEESRDYLKRVETEIERINRIVRELLDFSKPSKAEVREIEVNRLIENTLSLLSHQKSFKDINTQLQLQPDLPLIEGDESHLSQVLMNIVLNAIDAMPHGGDLRIRSEDFVVEDLFSDALPKIHPPRRRGDPAKSDYSQLRKPDPLTALLSKFSIGDRLVKISVSDTGIGISSEDLEKVFDPFFTTKEPDQGTGLGLSISLRIVESMGGKIGVESELGKGSTFGIFLPAATPRKNGIVE